MYMKKYYKPAIQVIELESSQNLLAGSLGSSDTPSANLYDAEDGSGVSADARFGGYFEDEDF